MNDRSKSIVLRVAGLYLPALLMASTVRAAPAEPTEEAAAVLGRFLERHCVVCHRGEEAKSGLRLDDLVAGGVVAGDVKRWQRVLEMVEIGDMPPKSRARPAEGERTAFQSTLASALRSLGVGRDDRESELPRNGNRVDHAALFSGEHPGPAYTPARVWRINGRIYFQLMQDLELGRDFVVPLQKNDEGFHDYASLYADEATIRTMMQNAKRAATAMIKGRHVRPRGAAEKDPANKGRYLGSRHRPITEFVAIEGRPTREQLDAVATFVLRHLTKREPSADQLERSVTGVLVPCVDAGGNEAGLHGYIVSVLLSPEFLFRSEVGRGRELPDGRRMLSPTELAFALSYTLHDHPVDSLLEAAREGRLKSREDVEREFRRLYDDEKLLRGRMANGSVNRVWAASKPYDVPAKPRLLRFFQEYFGYARAEDVFKDETRHGGKHDPRQLIKDANWTVLDVLADDRDVLEQLLTTDRFAVPRGRISKKNPDEKPRMPGYLAAYNLTESPENDRGFELTKMPAGQRAGLLTHPAWLVAHSTNFHTDPVRRGKWIQEHLLGYPVPDLPIAVQAQLPDEAHNTIRERFRVVRADACWRCHRKMNPLGEPFEAFDDFGRWRDRHLVGTDGNLVETDFERTNRFNPDHVKNAEPGKPVDTTGELVGTGDPSLDGPVADVRDLMRRLAKSDRVRQVFVRHVFRYWMGRNETLDDSPTLMAMDKAYVDSRGSFRETLVALITSDSFLLRK